jgi:pimeloyl-ACP methyl ester carboxylesterase
VLQNSSVRPDWRPPLYWRLMIAPGAGELALLRANAFGHGLPLMLRAARRDRELRERHRAPLRDPATRRTVLRLERMEGYAEECTGVIRALPDLGGPQLILWGQPDPAYLGEAPRLRALFPGARFVPIPGAGHFAAEDAAERVSEEVHAFLTG